MTNNNLDMTRQQSATLDGDTPMTDTNDDAFARGGYRQDDSHLLQMMKDEFHIREESCALNDRAQTIREGLNLPVGGEITIKTVYGVLPSKPERIEYEKRVFCSEDDLRRSMAGTVFETFAETMERWVMEWRESDAAIRAAEDAAGVTTLNERADRLREKADRLLGEIINTQPVTLEGVLAMLEFACEAPDDDVEETAIEGLRAIIEKQREQQAVAGA